MKETEDATKKWKDIMSSQIWRINVIKISILPKVIYRFNAVKILMKFFIELEQITLRFIWNHEDTEWPKQSWGEKKKKE